MAETSVSFDNGTIILNSPPLEDNKVQLIIKVVSGRITEIAARGNKGEPLDAKLSVKPFGETGDDGDQCRCLRGGVWVTCACTADMIND